MFVAEIIHLSHVCLHRFPTVVIVSPRDAYTREKWIWVLGSYHSVMVTLPTPEAKAGLVAGIAGEPRASEEVDEAPVRGPQNKGCVYPGKMDFVLHTISPAHTFWRILWKPLFFHCWGSKQGICTCSVSALPWCDTLSPSSLLFMRLLLVPTEEPEGCRHFLPVLPQEM